jgi:CelD/BcsL family acetyltransferase involved in cellulose biosynthesis
MLLVQPRAKGSDQRGARATETAEPMAGRWRSRPVELECYLAGRRHVVRCFSPQVFDLPFRDRTLEPLDDEAAGCLRTDRSALLFSHPVREPLPRLSRHGGALRYVTRQYRRHHVDTTGEFETYLGTLAPKTRQTLKRKVRRLCKEFGDDAPWREYKTPAELRQFHHLARAVARKTYHERLFDAGLPDATTYLDEAVGEGRSARGYLLLRRGTPVAYLYTPVDRGVALYMHLGYDPSQADWSPGAVLQYFALQQMFADAEIVRLDFGEGDGQHKATFATGHTLCADIYYFRPTASNLATIAAHLGVTAVDRSAAWLVDRLGVRSAVRRWLYRA